MTENLSCFNSYDVRSKLGPNFNNEICVRIGRSFAKVLNARKVVIGRDARASSPDLAKSIVVGLLKEGVEVLDIGLAGTEEMYWATSQFDACGGIEVTASHNPIDYNGLKMVKKSSKPLDPKREFLKIKEMAEGRSFGPQQGGGKVIDITQAAKKAYVKKVISFINTDTLKPLKVCVNSGNGAAGPTFDAVAKELLRGTDNIVFKRINHLPDSSFPNGIPNPLLSENHEVNKKMVLENGGDLGVAFDGDFDRCFFFDEKGSFIPGQFIVGLISNIFLARQPGSKIAHDPRAVWSIESVVKENEGIPVISKTGHAFIKQTMREKNCIYGGELSAHHYFKDFAYCDSGMIPCLLIIELLSRRSQSLSNLVKDIQMRFPSSPEINYTLNNPKKYIKKIQDFYADKIVNKYNIDGLSLDFNDWRLNVRVSNTEPVLRLNIETKGSKNLLNQKIEEINELLSD